MLVKVNRICRDGSVVECHVRNTDIRAVEKSDRDGEGRRQRWKRITNCARR